jgi:tetratricopeptide (TPR) repeat protein
MDLCEQLADLLSKTRNEVLRAKFLLLRGIIYRDQGNLEPAINDLEESLKIYERIDDQVHVGSVKVELGVSYYYQNQIEKAIANYRNAIISYQAVEYTRGIVFARYNLGDIMLQEEEYESAVRELQLALEIGKKRIFRNLELSAGLGLAEAYIALFQFDAAEKALDDLKPLLTKTKSTCFLGQELALQAYLHLKRHNNTKAHELFFQALPLLENPNCKYEYARANLIFAVFLKDQGQIDQAQEALILARDLFAELKNELGLRSVDRAISNLR